MPDKCRRFRANLPIHPGKCYFLRFGNPFTRLLSYLRQKSFSGFQPIKCAKTKLFGREANFETPSLLFDVFKMSFSRMAPRVLRFMG